MSDKHNKSVLQLLRDPDIQPGNDVISAALKNQYESYVKLLQISEGLGVTPEWRYYNDGKAWLGKCIYRWKSVRGTDKEKTIFWLSVWDGFFKVSFFFGEKNRDGLQNLTLSETTKKLIEDAKQMGKLKFFPLVYEIRSDVPEDFPALIEFQKSLR